MTLPCEIVEDLLPLVEEGLCSEKSRAAVEEHLKGCAACRELRADMHSFGEPEVPASAQAEDRAVRRSFRKIRRRWAVSLLAAVLMLPVLLLTVNQIRREGLCYTNLRETVVAGSTLRALADGDWEAAVAHVDYERQYREIQELLAMSPEDFLPRLTPVTIGQREWLASEFFYQGNLQDLEDGDLFWDQAVFNRAYPLIPLEGWEQIKAHMPGSIYVDGEDEIAVTGDLGELCYRRMETPWGTFMAEASSPLWDCATAYEFCSLLELVPEEMYEAAEADYERAAREHYDYIQEHFADVADMSPEDYCEQRRAAAVRDLAACAGEGFAFENPRYERAELVTVDGAGCWSITYALDVVRSGDRETIHISQTVSHNRILSRTLSWPGTLADADSLFDALDL